MLGRKAHRVSWVCAVACLALVGEQGLLEIDARVLSPDGEKEATAFGGGPVSDAAAIVQQLADDLLAQGADELIAQARDFPPKAS